MKQETAEHSYVMAWKGLRRRRALFAWASAVTLIYFVVVAWIFYRRNEPIESAFFVLFVGALPYAIIFHVLAFFRCPRCGRLLFMKYWFVDLFVKKCRHCGLPLWAAESGDDRAKPK